MNEPVNQWMNEWRLEY